MKIPAANVDVAHKMRLSSEQRGPRLPIPVGDGDATA